jgi:sugar phosphate isomerase/epimerase
VVPGHPTSTRASFPRVQLAISPDGRWEFATADLVAAAGAAGFSGVGINSDRVDGAAVNAYAAAGVRCHELAALVFNDDEAATTASAEDLAGAAAAIGATWVLTVFAAPLTPETERILRRCAAVFADAGAGMAVEFSPLGPISSIQKGMEVVRAVNRGAGRAGLMIDSWHFCFGDSTWDDLAEVPLDDVAYVQFADARAPESKSLARETMHRRALPGEGVLELDRFATTLLERGWDGTVSVEVLSAELRALPVDVLVRRIYDATVPFWT